MPDDPSGYARCPFAAEFYDHISPYVQRPDIEFYTSLAKESGGPVLEVACGTGRVLLPIAQAGIPITGLDLSDAMLTKCRAKLAEQPKAVRERVELIQGDMRSFDLGKTFKLATTPFRGFQHLLETEDQLATLRSVYNHLEPGGRLVLECFNPDMKLMTTDGREEEHGDEPAYELPDGRSFERKFRIMNMDYTNQRYDMHMIYHVHHPDGRHDCLVHRSSMRYIFRWEAEHLLARCGFGIEAVYGSFDRSPVTAESHDLIFVACRLH